MTFLACQCPGQEASGRKCCGKLDTRKRSHSPTSFPSEIEIDLETTPRVDRNHQPLASTCVAPSQKAKGNADVTIKVHGIVRDV
jgi:hypothetical protein